jgi:Dolichyl-phosphate-mannose-protein mannosyltransferase
MTTEDRQDAKSSPDSTSEGDPPPAPPSSEVSLPDSVPSPPPSPPTPAPVRRKLPSLRLPEAIGWRDHLIGASLGLVYVAWLLTGARALGFPRDEGIYFRAGESYIRWWRMLFERGSDALQQSAIDSAFSMNHEHPPLFKTLFGASWLFFHDKWRLFEDASTAFRFPGMLSAGMLLWVTYLFGARAYGRRAGLVAALLLGLMPRVFFHAHLACFDVPITAMWTLCVYVHWRAQAKGASGWWAIAAGVVFGLTLATKHNAWLMPAIFVPHAIWVHRRFTRMAWSHNQISLPRSLYAMAILGPMVLIAVWPYVWNDTLPRLQWWFEFHTHHDYYNIEFLGKNYFGPPSPRSYVPVMVAATVPTVTLLLFLVGGFDRAAAGARRLRAWALGVVHRPAGEAPASDPLETDLLLLLSILVAMGWFMRSTTPIFGGTKHWMPAYPALALFAGRGFELVVQAMRRALPSLHGPRWLGAQIALVAAVVVAPLVVTAHSHPFGLSAYVPMIGGTAGGADLGLDRQFWGFTTESAAVEYLNDNAPRNATVFIHDTTGDAWNRMQEEGRIRRDLRAVGAPHEAQFALVQHELHMNEVDYSIWVADGTDAPAYIVEHDGVPIVSVYKR